jgi:hypothetical protein
VHFVLRLAQEFFTYMETLPLPVKCLILGTQGLWHDLYRTTPAATRGISRSHSKDCPHLIASYDSQEDAEDLYYLEPYRFLIVTSNRRRKLCVYKYGSWVSFSGEKDYAGGMIQHQNKLFILLLAAAEVWKLTFQKLNIYAAYTCTLCTSALYKFYPTVETTLNLGL